MVLPVVKYGTPVLRQKGSRIEAITPEIDRLIADMFETMRSASGVGLAAQQVGHPLQLMVIDVRAAKERPSSMEIEGKPADPASFMPMALINPRITPTGKLVAGAEGCLSFPEIFGDIERPETVNVVATLPATGAGSAAGKLGKEIEFHCGGLLARVIQHELDHLQGILFIDRMDRQTKAELKADIDEIQAQTKADARKK